MFRKKLIPISPTERSRTCGHQDITYIQYYAKPGASTWFSGNYTKGDQVRFGANIACPSIPDTSAGVASLSKQGALDDTRGILAKASCGSCEFFGLSKIQVDLLIADRAIANATRLKAKTEELKAQALHDEARAELDAITKRFTSF